MTTFVARHPHRSLPASPAAPGHGVGSSLASMRHAVARTFRTIAILTEMQRRQPSEPIDVILLMHQ